MSLIPGGYNVRLYFKKGAPRTLDKVKNYYLYIKTAMENNEDILYAAIVDDEGKIIKYCNF